VIRLTQLLVDILKLDHRRHGNSSMELIITIAAIDEKTSTPMPCPLTNDWPPTRRRTVRPALRSVREDLKGDTLGGDLNGHEHFGFKDGISQPAIREGSPLRRKLSSRRVSLILPRRLRIDSDGQDRYFYGQDSYC